MPVSDYGDILAHLQRAKQTVITPWMLQEMMNPSDPPDDPYWPAPSNSRHFYNLARRLEHRQLILCLATGVQMAISLWHDWVIDRDEFSDEEKLAPLHAAQFAERWALGEEPMQSKCSSAAEEAVKKMRGIEFPNAGTNWRGQFMVEQSHAASNAYYLASCAVEIARGEEVTRYSGPGETFMVAITNGYGREGRRRFLALWWARCRARLAFAGSMKADIE